MKKIFYIIAIISILVCNLTIFTSCDTDEGSMSGGLYGNMVDYSAGTSTTHAWRTGQWWWHTSDWKLGAISFQLKNYEENDIGTVSAYVYTWEYDDIDDEELIMVSDNSFSLSALDDEDYQWYTFYFSDNTTLEDNTEYAFMCIVDGGEESGRYQIKYYAVNTVNGEIIRDNGTAYNYDCNIRIYSKAEDDVQVITNEPIYESMGVVRLSGYMPFNSWGETYDYYIEMGLDDSYGLMYEVDYTPHGIGSDSYDDHYNSWEKAVGGLEQDIEYHFRASAYGSNGENWYYGGDKTFEIDSSAQSSFIECEVNDLGYDTEFLVYLISLGSETSVDLEVKYATTLDGLMNTPGTLSVATGASSEGQYTYTDSAGNFEPGQVYYYRAFSDGTTFDVYSEVGKFLKSDPDKNSGQDAIERWWFGLFGGDDVDIVWWLMLALIIILSLYYALEKKNKWILIIGTLLGVAVLVVMVESARWLVALLALIVGLLYGLKWVKDRGGK